LIGLDGSVKITDFGYSVQLNASTGSGKRSMKKIIMIIIIIMKNK